MLSRVIASKAGARRDVAQALQLHHAGRLNDAEEIYRELITAGQFDSDTLKNFGILLYQRGDFGGAIENFRQACRITPNDSVLRGNYGAALKAGGKHRDALKQYGEAIRLNPKNANAYYCRGNLFGELGRFEEARDDFEETIRLDPRNAFAHNNLALVYAELGDHEAAEKSFSAALRLNPNYVEALFNRGNTFDKLGRQDLACGDYQAAVKKKPDFIEALNNLGNLYRDFGRHQEALGQYEQVLQIDPSNRVGLNNKAASLSKLGQFNESMAIIDRLIATDPADIDAIDNRGNLLAMMGDNLGALESYEKALALQPRNARTRWNRSLARLLIGDYDSGWADYESRWDYDAFANKNKRIVFGNQLSANDLLKPEGTVFLYGEQGAGDYIQFVRYAQSLARVGFRVLLKAPDPLKRLMQGFAEGVDLCSTWPDASSYDFHCPLLSVPASCGATFWRSALGLPYLRVGSEINELWRQRLGQRTQPRIGLVWSGNPTHSNDENRSIGAYEFLAGMQVDGELHSLQKEYRNGDLEVMQKFSVVDHSAHLADFMDTAALAQQMDLIISVDTSVAHLAGAIGRPCWVLLPFIPDWRWGESGETTMWYDSVKLFRQDAGRCWAAVFSEINGALRDASLLKAEASDLVLLDSARYQKRLPSVPLSGKRFTSDLASPLVVNISEEIQRAASLISIGNFEEARSAINRILAVDFHNSLALGLLGECFLREGHPEDARIHFEHALQFDPNNINILLNYGLALCSLGKALAAIQVFDSIVSQDSDHVAALQNRACMLKSLGEFRPAMRDLDRVLELDSTLEAAHIERADINRRIGRVGEAFADIAMALALNEKNAFAHNLLGVIYLSLNDPIQAKAAFECSLELTPDQVETLTNYGAALAKLNDVDRAIDAYQRALSLRPDDADVHFNLAVSLLLKGEFLEGWKHYEWRWRRRSQKLRREFAAPAWKGGTNIRGKRLLVSSEQGYGDVIQFSRYLPALVELGAAVVVEAPKPLASILERIPGVSKVLSDAAPPGTYDCYCRLMSLPGLLGTDEKNIPGPERYLSASATHVDKWAGIVGPKCRARVGLVWSGSIGHANDRDRSLSLQQLVEFLPESCDYLSLQREVRLTDADTLENSSVRDFSSLIVDFDDTAAICELVDLIVSVDTSVAHLAGALGRRVICLLPFAPDWRWQLSRTDSPWYPTMTLLRQDSLGDWSGPLKKLRAEVESLYSEKVATAK